MWYASHIYADPQESIRSIFASHPVLSKGLYWLQQLEAWDYPQGGQRPDALPTDGLLVTRELCQPDTREYEWHQQGSGGGNALSWVDVDSSENIDIIQLPRLPVAGNGEVYLDSEWAGVHPPVDFLRFLKSVSTATNSVVSFYHHASGAEQTQDQEFAWVFGEEDCVYVRHMPTFSAVSKYTQSGVTTHSKGILPEVLSRYGIGLHTSYFPPHTRDFDWARYKI